MGLAWRVAAVKIGVQDELAYRVEFLLSVVSSAVVPAAVQWVLWYALFSVGGATSVGGMSYSDLLAYTAASVLFSQVRGGDYDFELAEMIRDGSLSNYLLKPVNVIEFVFLRAFGPKLLLASLCFLVGSVVLSPVRMAAAMILAILGNVIHYLLSSALASVAFYWEEAYSVLMVKNMVVGILSGETIPLNLFPREWAWVWEYTPFYLYVFGPTQIALGKWDFAAFVHHLGIAVVWLFLAVAVATAAWRVGIKRYSSLGG